jgi:cation-dependent mannose-6-phosphate receptor
LDKQLNSSLRRLESYEPIFRGRKLVLNYTGGSLCPSSPSSKRHVHEPISLPKRDIVPDDDDVDEPEDKDKKKHDDDDDKKKHDDDNDDKKKQDGDDNKKEKKSERRKTTVISLLCEKDALAKTSVSFVAAVDDCVYFFEGRSPYACGGVEAETQALSPGGVFGVIVLITVAVYLAGGVIYQRHVMHQRGWRQLPNYAVWAGIGGFVRVGRHLIH